MFLKNFKKFDFFGVVTCLVGIIELNERFPKPGNLNEISKPEISN